VDRLRFNQIFLNLLSNALKFTPAGGEISLRMSHTAQADGKPLLTAVVADSGRGMDPEFAAHAFDAFAQEHAEDGERGTGLGLTIVKNLVDLMGGSIQIESRPGSGTRITVCLPAAAAQPPAEKRNDTQAELSVLRGKRVLLCEDQPLNQKVAVYLLEKAGVRVEIAENGQRGVSLFGQSPPGHFDAVLMDVRMPVMDGIAATAAIRALGRADASAVPIIALTADAYEEDVKKSNDAGMNAHLSKPVDPQMLYSTLARFLSGDRAAAPVP